MLQGIPGYESDAIPVVATIEPGALGIAACRSGNDKRRRDRSKSSFYRAWSVRGGLSRRFWRNAVRDIETFERKAALWQKVCRNRIARTKQRWENGEVVRSARPRR